MSVQHISGVDTGTENITTISACRAVLGSTWECSKEETIPTALLHYINYMIGRKKGLPKGHLLKHDLMTF